MLRRLTIMGAVVLGISAFPALALETGQCLPAAQARQAVSDEHMNPLIVGNRSGYANPTALIFFSNAEGSKGYAFLADKPFGEQATTICVQSVYRDIRLNDITRAGIPSWARIPVDRTRALALCGRGGLGYQDACVPENESSKNLESNNVHVMFVAMGTAINPRDQTVRAGQRIVVAVDPVKNTGIVKAVTTEGASYMLSAYSSVAYTQHGSERLRR